MAGNLVDNACKWAASQVFIEVLVEPPAAPGAGPRLRIIVDDDGRGLSAAERAQVSRRGQRLDESKPGSGLGLSIVVDLAALYGGSLVAGRRPDRRLAGGTGAAGGLNVPSGDDLRLLGGNRQCPAVDFVIPKRLLNAHTSKIGGGRALPVRMTQHIHTGRMSQTSTERLRDYLAQLPPQSQALLMREFERAIERGEDVAVANFVLEQLRKVVRGAEEDDEARPRTDDPARLLFRPLEPFLVESNFPVRPGRSGAPRCCRSGNGSAATARPRPRANSKPRLPRSGRAARPPASKRDPQVPARRSRGDRQDRDAGRRATTGSARCPASARPMSSRICCRSAAVLRAREALDTLGSRLAGPAAGLSRSPDRLGDRRSTFPRCRRRNCCRSRCR